MKKNYLIALIGLIFLFGCKQTVKSDIFPNNYGDINQKTAEAHFNTKVADIINNQIVLVSNIDSLVANWENIVNHDPQLDLNFETVNIEVVDGEYYLVGVDDNALAVSKIGLVLDNNVFYEKSYPGPTPSSPSLGWTCTCSGCTSTGPGSSGECSPKHDENGWYCTDCSQGTCTKSETAGTSGVLD